MISHFESLPRYLFKDGCLDYGMESGPNLNVTHSSLNTSTLLRVGRIVLCGIFVVFLARIDLVLPSYDHSSPPRLPSIGPPCLPSLVQALLTVKSQVLHFQLPYFRNWN